MDSIERAWGVYDDDEDEEEEEEDDEDEDREVENCAGAIKELGRVPSKDCSNMLLGGGGAPWAGETETFPLTSAAAASSPATRAAMAFKNAVVGLCVGGVGLTTTGV